MSITKIEALANELGLEVDEVEESKWGGFEADGADYIVATDSEADTLAIQSIKDLIDDIGAFGFSDMSTFQILNYYLQDGWFEEVENESNESYAEDIQNESSSDDDLYVNRLHEELVDAGLMEELDLPEEPEDDVSEWEKECDLLREDAESKASDLVIELAESMNSGDSVTWFKDNFGEEALSKAAQDNNLVDEDAFAQWVVDTDGRGHVLSGYDGEELELEDNLYAYRTN